MKYAYLFLFFLVSIFATAAPFDGQIKSFKQPDGSKVDLRLFGTEYYMRAEGLDGYTLIRDEKTKWICYADLSDDKNKLISTGLVYKGLEANTSTLKSGLKWPLHLDISIEARMAVIAEKKNKLGDVLGKRPGNGNQVTGTPVHNLSGNVKGLCIVIDFSDEPGIVPFSEFESFCNGTNYTGFGNKGSLRKYYSDISGGLLDYENAVFGYFRAPLTFAAYDAMPYAVGAQQILGLALHWIKQQGFDFSTLSVNADNTIQAINMMYTGEPPVWAEGMWHHAGYYDSFSSNGVLSGSYNCSPANSPLGLAVMAHENGHMIGKWPDTYKYESTTGPDGIGAFDLMCSYGDDQNPTIPNPLFRANAGWGKVTDINDFNGIITDTSEDGKFYRYLNPEDTNEFFLIESRQKAGRSQFIPADGLTIWHIDRNGDNQTTHHEVYLMHANNNINGHANACWRAGYRTEFSSTTTPNSNFYSTEPSGLKIWSIGPRGTVMTYKIGAGQDAASFHLKFNGISADDNNNGFVEPGESVSLSVNALNLGQIASVLSKVTCKPIGSTASYVTVNTDTVFLGPINVTQSLDAVFNVAVQSNTPIGTELSFRFTIYDGPVSIYIVKKVIVGVLVVMSNDTSTTCSGIFVDDGETQNYQNNMDFQKTIFPAEAGKKLQIDFVEFAIENAASCGKDYLEIYDGPDTGFPYLGAFCGTTLPEQIIASDISGALTFFFHSDEGTVLSGWKALVTCFSPLKTSDLQLASKVEAYPNPTSGMLQIRSNTASVTTISVTDILGKEVLTQTGSGLINLDLSTNPNGIYFLRHQTSEGVSLKKIVLKR